MKVFVSTLLFTFLVVFTSIDLSLQSDNVLRGRRYPNPDLVFHARQLPNIPAGQYYILPNGNVYKSRGTGNILVIYNAYEKKATIHQAGGPTVTLGRGPYGERHYSEEFPHIVLDPIPRRVLPNN